VVADLSPSEAVDIALAVFLILVGVALAYAFVTAGLALARVAGFIRRAEGEVLPLLEETSGTVTRVNRQLDKVDEMTDSAVDAVRAADRAVRAVSSVVTTPVQKLSGLVAGVSHGTSSLRARRDWHDAVRVGKEAAARREADLAHELDSGADAPAPAAAPAGGAGDGGKGAEPAESGSERSRPPWADLMADDAGEGEDAPGHRGRSGQ